MDILIKKNGIFKYHGMLIYLKYLEMFELIIQDTNIQMIFMKFMKQFIK